MLYSGGTITVFDAHKDLLISLGFAPGGGNDDDAGGDGATV